MSGTHTKMEFHVHTQSILNKGITLFGKPRDYRQLSLA